MKQTTPRRASRAARRKLRRNRRESMLPGLERGLPLVEPMSAEQIERIDNASILLDYIARRERKIPVADALNNTF